MWARPYWFSCFGYLFALVCQWYASTLHHKVWGHNLEKAHVSSNQ